MFEMYIQEKNNPTTLFVIVKIIASKASQFSHGKTGIDLQLLQGRGSLNS